MGGMMVTQEKVQKVVSDQRRFFETGKTKEISFRREQLKTFLSLTKDFETKILDALYADLRKPQFEGFMSEVGLIYAETRFALRHLKSWAKPRPVMGSWFTLLSRNWIYSEPRGVALIVGPWNYPLQLVVTPLIGAMAAGNCVVIKPSEYAPATASILREIIQKGFDPEYLNVVEGDAAVGDALVHQPFDYIFYTGGSNAATAIMKAASERLTPITLELGGKSPAIVDQEVDLKLAAKRIVWGKFWNAGQTCIAPDYVLVQKMRKTELIDQMKKYLQTFYGEDPIKSPDYARIINERHFNRLVNLMKDGKKIVGGDVREEDLYISPTIIDGVTLSSPLMGEEIFGPLLPIIEFQSLDEAIDIVQKHPKPLSLYFFSNNKKHQEKILREISFGGGCINDTLLQFTNPRLPFGGVGGSGMGQAHGKYSYDTFSHFKSIVKSSPLSDLLPKYPPYGNKINWMKRIMRGL